MKSKRLVDMALLSVLCLGCFTWSTAGHGELTPEFALAGVQEGLVRSPDHFVAALVQVTSPPKCEEEAGAAACFQEGRLVRVFAARGGVVQGTTIVLVGEGRIGTRTLGFFVPIPDSPGVFAATLLSTRTGKKEVKVLVDALRTAGLGRPVA